MIILSAAALFILIILYRLYDTRVEKPRMLDDELKDALADARPDVVLSEPVRNAAAAIAYRHDKVVLVHKSAHKFVSRIYPVRELMGIEVFVDDHVAARVIRGGLHKPLDDLKPDATKVRIRLMFDDPPHPDFDIALWDPNDAMTARAEGPKAAMETARRWFYHVEAIVRRPFEASPAPVTGVTPPPRPSADLPPTGPDLPSVPPPMPHTEPSQAGEDKVRPERKEERDILNAPLIPYL